MPSRRSVRIMRTAISPRFATRTVSNIALHPKHAVGHRFQRRVCTNGQSEAEHISSIEWIDDAIVPEASGGVVGVSLLFVLPTNGSPETLLGISAPRFPSLFHLVATHRGEHG